MLRSHRTAHPSEQSEPSNGLPLVLFLSVPNLQLPLNSLHTLSVSYDTAASLRQVAKLCALLANASESRVLDYAVAWPSTSVRAAAVQAGTRILLTCARERPAPAAEEMRGSFSRGARLCASVALVGVIQWPKVDDLKLPHVVLVGVRELHRVISLFAQRLERVVGHLQELR